MRSTSLEKDVPKRPFRLRLETSDVCFEVHSRHELEAPKLPLLTQSRPWAQITQPLELRHRILSNGIFLINEAHHGKGLLGCFCGRK
jgi:hypothetical protein